MGTENQEKLGEKEKPTPFKGEGAFDPKEAWNNQTTIMVAKAMGIAEDLRLRIGDEILPWITSGDEFDKFKGGRDKIRTMKLEQGIIYYLDAAGKTIAKFDIAPGIADILSYKRDESCERCKEDSVQSRVSLARNPRSGVSENLLYYTARRRYLRVSVPSKPPVDAAAVEAQERSAKLSERNGARREDILRSAETESKFDVRAFVPPQVRNADKATFEREWKFFDGNHRILDLFRETPARTEGYSENPFVDWNTNQPWTIDNLRELTQEWRNEELRFSEVIKKIYADRFKEFKKRLEDRGVPKVILNLLGEKPENITDTYKKLRKIMGDLEAVKNPKQVPENLREFWPHREKIAPVANIVGDYIAYSVRLTNAVNELQYNPAKETLDRELLLREQEVGPNGKALETEANHIKQALEKIFPKEELAREYTSELRHWFSFAAKERPVTFQDLRGQTVTAHGEWFTDYQSSNAGFKDAYETIEELGQVSEEKAVGHINRLLELGMAASGSIPAQKSMREIMDELQEEGTDIRFSGEFSKNFQALYRTLSIIKLNEIDSGGQVRKAARLRFIRIGAVIWGKSAERMREIERQKSVCAKIKFSEKQTNAIIQDLEDSGKFDKNQLQKLKSEFIGGAVVVTPREGGGFGMHYEFDNGLMLDVTGAIQNWSVVGPGIALGKKHEAPNDITVTWYAAGGYLPSGPARGPAVGEGFRITKHFKNIDIYAEGGGGALFGANLPAAFAGLGVNWGKTHERFEENLKKKEAKAHIAELDKSGNAYAKARENPDRYPAFKSVLYSLDNLKGIDAEAKRAIFESAYGLFKDGIKKESRDEIPRQWISGIGLGVVFIGKTPVPYAYIESDLWKRNLVFRIATNERASERVAESLVRQKLLERYSARAEIKEQVLSTSGELVLDRDGRLSLDNRCTRNFDFGKYNEKFEEFRDELAKQAKILVEPVGAGLLWLRPMEAYGNIELYLDPKLGDDVQAVTRGGRLMLSIKENANLFITRRDITYPFAEKGATEKVTLVVSKNPHVDLDTVQGESDWFLEQLAGREWQKKPRDAEARAKPAAHLMDENEYRTWWGTGRGDRLEFESVEDRQQAYSRLVSSVSLERTMSNQEIRPGLKEKIKDLAADRKFLKVFRDLTTKQYPLFVKGTPTRLENGDPNFPEALKRMKERLGYDLNDLEVQAAFYELLIASFQNIHREGADPKQEYLKFLEGFERPMLMTLFVKYYEGDKDQEAKAGKAVDWMIERMKNIDVTQQGAGTERGVIFATLVGLPGTKAKVTGFRPMYNFRETKPEWGLVGKQKLNVKDKGMNGEIAKFWIETLSELPRGLHKLSLPENPGSDEWNEYQDKMYDALRSPIATKLIKHVAVLFSKQEMEDLTKIFESERGGLERTTVSRQNIDSVRKFLKICEIVREAEIRGEKEVALPGTPFRIAIETSVEMAIYKKCGNISGLVREDFALIHEGRKQMYFASMAETNIQVRPGYTKTDFRGMVGAGIAGI